jgi:hypothetical protein
MELDGAHDPWLWKMIRRPVPLLVPPPHPPSLRSHLMSCASVAMPSENDQILVVCRDGSGHQGTGLLGTSLKHKCNL